MNKIKIKIDGRVAEIESAPEVVTDNAEYEVEFAVDERDGWNPTVPMTALFVRRDARYTAVVMDAGETICTMPPQTGTNIVYVGLTQDDMRTTTPAAIKVQRSIRTVANDPLPAPTEDVYAQILAAYAGTKILSGKGAPTSATVGRLNQLYRDESTDKLYICTGVEGGYTWAAVVSDTEEAVTYTAQTLTEEQKTQARANIGAGTSNFSGLYNDLPDKPNIPAATVIDTTLTKSGQAADAKAAGDAIEKKLDATALPTAINDALAQAKASGEFNGAKGEKGDPGEQGIPGEKGEKGDKGDTGAQGIRGEKGDTGPAGEKGDTGPVGPQGETGPAGQKGADGKDGAGMDVTGAKVGQIAKITAVDSVGKPTAWEAVDMPSGGGVGGHWETVLDTVWEQDVINPTAFDSETGIFTCAEGELNNLELNKEYVFFQQCAVKDVAYNTILSDNKMKVTNLSDTTFSIDVTPPATFVPTNVKFSKGACLVITDIDAKKIRLTLDGQFSTTSTLYDRPFYGMNAPYFGQNVGYQKIRSAYQAYQQVTAEVESPYRIVGKILCGFNAPSANASFHFKNNSFCCPLVPTEFPDGNTYLLTSDGTKIAKLYSTSVPWHLGGSNENTAIDHDYLRIISGTKVKLERWVE